ncbi:hypothetical protein I5535_05310 [Rhodobacteraceae bacterium F11138]|nr:hypothetical protein [Rhodobacteraceae bacterium F11138]
MSEPATGPVGGIADTQLDETPLARARTTGQDLVAHLAEQQDATPESGLENFLGLLGAVAGFSTVYALVRRLDDGSLSLRAPDAMQVILPNGTKRYFGSFLNRRLAEQQISLFNLAAGTAKSLGAERFPDLPELFERVAQSATSADFGVPRLPDGIEIDTSPETMLTRYYSGCLPVLGRYGLHADDYFAACAFAVQRGIAMSKDRINPELSVRIVMECAVPMSKIDPRAVLADF